ncbi:MAG TPA: alpha/beta fold hydrolase [Candidatus Acidoferrum sp.]|nr:alpha/beta fold hydrolase [Candidatus Acidoferrum sp.]
MKAETLATSSDAVTSWPTQFAPRRFLSNGHLQTLAGNFLRRRFLLPEAESLVVEVEGPVGGYGPSYVLCHCHWQPPEIRRERLTVIIVHGLEGSSTSQYVLGNSARALAAGFNVVRMNMRSCGGTDELSPTIYHSGRSEDVAAVIARIIETHGIEAIALIGYSMGGNLVLKYAGEVAGQLPLQLKAVVGVSPLMDLAVSSAALHEPRNRLYEWHFLSSMLERVRRKAVLFPGIYSTADLPPIRTMRQFDEHVVARYGGFTGADDYYYRVASSQYASRLRLPTLILHSLDDPFIRMLPATRSALTENPHVSYVETERGGHCAFLAAAKNDDGRWAETTLLGFLRERADGSGLGR